MASALFALLVTVTVSAEDWVTFNRTLDARRYVPLKQIDRGNVTGLSTVCEADMGILGTFHTGPLLIGNSLYLTTGLATVALDPTNCKVRWKHLVDFDGPSIGTVNRGLAYFGGRLFRGTSHGLVLALDAASGRELWRVSIADPGIGEYVTMAPVVWRGLLLIGIAGSDFGVKGRVVALDVKSGREVWRFNAIPGPGEPGYESWSDTKLRDFGGAGTWSTFTLDPITGEVFIPFGNPAPMYAPDSRPGANLYTNAFVVLDAKTGKLKWYFQITPHDSHDYDLAAAPVPYTDPAGRELVIVGSKDGYLYGIDRTTHRLAWRVAVTTVANQEQEPTAEGVHACPGNVGGIQWNGPAIDPERNLVFVGSTDWCGIFTRGEPVYMQGNVYLAGGYKPAEPSDKARGWIYAVDASSGQTRWKFHAPAPILSAITPTAGGVVFAGDLKGTFYVFDADDGTVLLKHDTGGSMTGGMLSYRRGGKQYVAYTSGSMTPRGFSFDTEGKPKLVIMSLGQSRHAVPVIRVEAEPKVPVSKMTAHGESGPVARGRQLYDQLCSSCHGGDGGGLVGPSLKMIFDRKDAGVVLEAIKNPRDPMPRLYPGVLNDEDFSAVVSYVRTFK